MLEKSFQKPSSNDVEDEQSSQEKSRREQLKTEFGSIRKDWLEKQGVDLDTASYSELKSELNRFYKEVGGVLREALEIEGEGRDADLSSLAIKNIDFRNASEVREEIDLPKWVSLEETVAFIKTVLDYNDPFIKEKYFEYAAKGVSLDDMRNVLAYENDVKPARLDTDIHHQSPHRSRAAVEIVSNAIDAMQPEEKSIGRFGVGFYQILSHLNGADDRVIVETGNEETGFYSIKFRLDDNEIEFNLEELKNESPKGTKVTLKSEGFPAEEAEKLVNKHFAYNHAANVKCNGEVVNNKAESFMPADAESKQVEADISENGFTVTDNGRGMSPQVILEKLLVPKISGKPPVTEQIDEQNIQPEYFAERSEKTAHSSGKIIINVGGVMIEELPITGVNTVDTLVLEMPSFTILGEERDSIAVDEITIKAAKKLIDQVTGSEDIQLVNSLAPAIKELQNRSQAYKKEDNLVRYFQERVETMLSESDKKFLPNTPGFERVDLENTELLDPTLKQSAWKTIDGMHRPELGGSGDAVYIAPLDYNDESDSIIVNGKNRVVLDRAVYEELREDLTLINLYLETFAKAAGTEIRSLESFDENEENVSKREGGYESSESTPYESLDDYFRRERKRFGAPNAVTGRVKPSRPGDFKREYFRAEIEEKIINSFPAELSKYFTNYCRMNLDRENRKDWNPDLIDDVSTLAQNPELLDILAELDIAPTHRDHYIGRRVEDENTFYDSLRNNLSAKSREIKELSSKGAEWYSIPYYGEEVLINGEGKMYRHGFAVDDEGDTAAWYDKQSQEIRFIDTESGNFHEVTIPFENLSSKYGDKIIFINVKGEKCVGLKRQGAGVDEDSDRMFLFRVSDGEPVLNDIGDWKISGMCSFTDNLLCCERPNPNYDPSSLYHRSSDGPSKYLSAAIDPQTGEVIHEKSKRKEVHTQIKIDSNPDQYTREVSDTISVMADRDAQLLHVYIDGEEVQQIEANVNKETKRTLKRKYGAGVKLKTFEGSGGEGVVVGNPRYKEFTYTEEPEYPREEPRERTKRIKWREDVVINGNGEVVYEGEDDEHIKKIVGYDGKPYFKVTSLAHETLPGDRDSIDLKTENYDEDPHYFVLDENGNKVKGDSLKEIPPLKFSAQKRADRDRNRFSPYQPDAWKAKISRRGIEIVDRNSGEKLLDDIFGALLYHKEKEMWECITGDQKKGFVTSSTSVFIDAEGGVIEEAKVGKIDHKTPFMTNASDELETHPLSEEKTRIAQRVIEGYEDEDPDHIRRFIQRTLKYGDMSDEAYKEVAPVLMRLEYEKPQLMNTECIEAIATRIGDYDMENKVAFYSFFVRSLPPDTKNVLSEHEDLLEKSLKIFDEKIAPLPASEKRNVFESLSKLRNYRDEYLTTGWDIIRKNAPVPSESIPENIRPIIEYMRAEKGENINSRAKEEIEVSTDEPQFTLSQLIQTKRLNESEIANFDKGADELVNTVHEKIEGKHQEHIRREIIHPIYYQSVNNPYLFVRELVQNAHDALLESAAEEKSVSVDLLSRENETLTTRIEDPVGMTEQQLINYFLVPGESTKTDKQEQIGYFGQGLFTLFRGAKEVSVRTGVGDGKVTKMKITPRFDEEENLEDLDITIEEEQSDYKGTTIERVVDTDYPQVEAAYVKNATCSFTSLVDANIVDIELNGTRINEPQSIMASVDVPELGELKIYDAPNNAITQRGLFIKQADEDYDTGMKDVETFLEKRGYVLEIPDQIDLTRSRNELAQKENVLPLIQEKLPTAKVAAYLEFFKRDIQRGSVIQLDNLPYDFFHKARGGSKQAREDAERIANGKSVEDITPYKERGALIDLLIHLPVAQLDGETWSMYELRNAAIEEEPPLESDSKIDKLPNKLQEYLKEGKSENIRQRRRRKEQKKSGKTASNITLDNLENQPGFVQEIINNKKEAYKSFVEITESWLKKLDEKFLKDRKTDTAFFYGSDKTAKARANRFVERIEWNLNVWQGWKMDKYTENPDDEMMRSFLDTLSHEYAHILEPEDTSGMTHNQEFYQKQSQVLAQMVHERVREKKRQSN